MGNRNKKADLKPVHVTTHYKYTIYIYIYIFIYKAKQSNIARIHSILLDTTKSIHISLSKQATNSPSSRRRVTPLIAEETTRTNLDRPSQAGISPIQMIICTGTVLKMRSQAGHHRTE